MVGGGAGASGFSGIMSYGYGGGQNGDCVMLLPPLNIAEDVLENAILQLRKII